MKKQIAITLAACSAICLSAGMLVFAKHQKLSFADTNSYAIVMNSSKNKLHQFTDSAYYVGSNGKVKTELNNTILFSFEQIKVQPHPGTN